MASHMFLKLDTISGESEDKLHKNEIDVLAWNWGMSQAGNAHMGGGQVQEKSVLVISRLSKKLMSLQIC